MKRADWNHIGERVLLRSPVAEEASPVEEELAVLCSDCLSHNPALRPADALVVAGRLAAAERARPRTWPARAAARIRRLARMPALRLAVAAAVVILAGLQVEHVALRPPPCQGGPTRAATAWGTSQRDAILRAFRASGHPNAEAMFANVVTLVDRQVQRWVAAYTDACEATHVRGEQSASTLDLRMACLNDDLEATAALARVLASADRTIVDQAVEAASALGNIERCADARRLATMAPLPRDPWMRKADEDLRPSLSQANALLKADQPASAVATIDDVIRSAERIGYCPLLADALVIRADSLITVDEKTAAHCARLDETVTPSEIRHVGGDWT